MENLDKRIENLSSAKRALLELRLKQSATRQSGVAPIVSRKDRSNAPASFAQERLWFLNQLEPNTALYNVPRALRLKGNLDLAALQQAFDKLIERHETFRTRFEFVDGEVRQVIDATGSIQVTLTDLSDLTAAEQESETLRLIQSEATKPFNLATGPLKRVSVLRLGEQDHVLMMTNHHIISDAWSGGILFQELTALYNAVVTGTPSALPSPAVQYADFAAWQREWLQGDELQRQLDYWKEQLAGVSGVLELPTDFPRAQVQYSRGDYKFITLSKELSQQLHELSQRKGVTLFMTLLAGFQILLARYSNQTDIVVGSPIAGRNRAETEKLIGFFINTLVFRAGLSRKATFDSFLSEVRETALQAFAHQDLPFEKLVEELQPERDLNRNPLFQVMFQFQNTASPKLRLEGVEVTALDAATSTAKFDLMLAAREEDDALTCVMEYNTELFKGQTIELMLKQYATLLSKVVARPDELVSNLSLLTADDEREILQSWNDTAAEFPREKTIHQLFEEQVSRTPDAVALVAAHEQVNFAELNKRANQLANYLVRAGLAAEDRVAICLERSVDMIVALLAVLKGGGAYVPLEPNYPAERISFIVENSQAKLVLTNENLEPVWSGAKIVRLNEISSEVSQERTDNDIGNTGEDARATSTGHGHTGEDASATSTAQGHTGEDARATSTAQNAAHVIYTSGSTGRPKGVISSHSASINRFAWMWQEYPFAADDVCCQKTSLSFVDSIWEIFGPLLQGVPLCMIPDEVVKDPAQFVAALANQRVTRLVLVPSLLRAMLDDGNDLAARLSHLRICVCSGETLPASLAAEFGKRLPNTRLINLYGSSEVAADVTCFEVAANAESNVPIGKPIGNTQVFVLDENLRPAAVNVPGQIFVGGEGLARGYLNQPEMTAERFIPNPFAAGQRVFRTGDIGRYLPDGNIEYRGRRDHQVKLRGFRIELGEIETALLGNAVVNDAVVMLRDLKGTHDGQQLVAYLTTNGEAPTPAELRSFLRAKLPDYMAPALFVVLEKLPLTASGKINRQALPEPERMDAASASESPRTQTEEILASIWARELKRDTVGIDDDFFALGGHSLLQARIGARISETFKVELPLRTLFEAPTIRELARHVELARHSDAASEPPLVKVSREIELPLSFAQERLWFFDQIEPNSAAYNIPRALRLFGRLDRTALARSLEMLVQRHEVLRSTFHSDQGKPVLKIAATSNSEISWVDGRGTGVPPVSSRGTGVPPVGSRGTGVPPVSSRSTSVPPVATDQEARIKAFVKQEITKPFNLAAGPLLRVTVAQLDEHDHVLVLTMHHIVSDGWSVGIALSELIAGYNANITGANLSLPKLAVQYADFAAWQRRSLTGDLLRKKVDFWRRQLDGAPALLELPLDRPRTETPSFRGAKQTIKISSEVGQELKKLAASESKTIFMTLLSAYQILLACIAGTKDIVVGAPAAGRERAETQDLIGYFVNTMVLRTKVDDDLTFREVLNRVRQDVLSVLAHQDVPFEKLVDELGVSRTLAFNPIFQVWFVLQNATINRQDWHELRVEPINVDSGVTRHDLQLSLWESRDALEGLEGEFTYSTDLFEAKTIDRIAQQFLVLLSSVTADPDSRVSELQRKLAEAGLEIQQRQANELEDASRDRLRSAKRRAVSVVTGSAEKVETI
ncbi:MAG TPA: amino acid adenylation domain-containing protein [Pyrinomonadaceae bacterium]|nr:amino acid adenylation domain-containing protein [Pyrinomonadaceae bacterium]